MTKQEVDSVIERALEIAFAGGRRANKMEHQRNEARRKAGVAKRRWRARVEQLERTNSTLSDQVAKLTMENERLSKLSQALASLPQGTILIKGKNDVEAPGLGENGAALKVTA